MRNPYLAKVLKQRRSELGMTLKDVAEKMGVSEATVQRWESGNMSIRYERVIELAEVLNVSPQMFYGWGMKEQVELTSDERMIIEAYRGLSDEGKDYVRKTIKMASKLEASK